MPAEAKIKSSFGATWVRTLTTAIVIGIGGIALAQNVLVFVNGEPITALDLEQRSKFIVLTTQKPAPRQEVLEQLIDEKLKIKEGKRWGIEASDADVNNSYLTMARRMQLTAEQLTQTLAKSGVNADTLKSRIRADIVWQSLVRGRYQSRLQLTDRDVLTALESKSAEERDAVGFEYMLRPILLLITPGSSGPIIEGRRKEAEALRKRFRGCEESIPAVRAMRDVAVRGLVIRASADLPEALRKVLDSVPVGELTAPETTRHGIEMFAVCGKNETKSDTPSRRAVRENLLSQRFEQESKRYLQTLRRAAMIQPGK
jgi:peptidyl-prolyl cis-trans isomerase SurA